MSAVAVSACTRNPQPRPKANLAFPSMPLGTHFKEDLKPVAGYEVPARKQVNRAPAQTDDAKLKKVIAKKRKHKAHSKRHHRSHRRSSHGTVGNGAQLAQE